MYDLTEIEKMDFKNLRNAVQELYDKYVKLKRTFDDALNNIDESNLATTFHKKLNGYESMFSITADKIESRVSYEDLENNLIKYSTIKQTAEQIEMSVVSNKEYTDSASEQLSSTFTMTAEGISTNVIKLNKKVDGNYEKLYSSLTQTAEAIETIVGKELTEYFETTTKPTAENTSNEQKKILCNYKDTLYYFNKITNTWRKYQDGGVKTAFKQTADGFELNGCVSISGDLITSGTIKGVDIVGTRLWGNHGNNRYFKVVSGVGDIGLFNSNAMENATGSNPDCVWGITTPTQGGGFSMYSCGQWLMQYSKAYKTTYLSGTWDFSSCNVIGLPTGITQ